MKEDLKRYIEDNIIPRYDSFDKGHRRDHVETVIAQALELSRHYDVDEDMVYTAAAYHDTGICEGRATHHTVSARIIREDKNLRKWFSEDQIETIADAAEDHRASSDHEPRTIYGRLIAEADREIIPDVVIRRTIQFGLDHYPEIDKEGHWQRTLEHLHEKYAEGGYLKLWIPESPNAARLEDLRAIIRDEPRLRSVFEKVFDAEQSAVNPL
jgi:Predicted HD superfamily hydrolase